MLSVRSSGEGPLDLREDAGAAPPQLPRRVGGGRIGGHRQSLERGSPLTAFWVFSLMPSTMFPGLGTCDGRSLASLALRAAASEALLAPWAASLPRSNLRAPRTTPLAAASELDVPASMLRCQRDRHGRAWRSHRSLPTSPGGGRAATAAWVWSGVAKSVSATRTPAPRRSTPCPFRAWEHGQGSDSIDPPAAHRTSADGRSARLGSPEGPRVPARGPAGGRWPAECTSTELWSTS